MSAEKTKLKERFASFGEFKEAEKLEKKFEKFPCFKVQIDFIKCMAEACDGLCKLEQDEEIFCL